MNLDEPARFGEVDSRDALGDLESVAGQWAEAGGLARGRLDLAGVRAVVVAGMGGSGIAGDVAALLGADVVDVPVVVHKGYGLPAFVDPSTVVIAVSHSGETAETLDAADTALKRGARLVGVSGGGRLADRCPDHVLIPRRTPPRHALPLLCVPVLGLLGLDADLDETVTVVAETTAANARGVTTADNEAKQVAGRVASSARPTILGAQGVGATAAYRMACQLAENAKLLAIHGQVPEAAHNVVAAWPESGGDDGGLVLLGDPDADPPRLAGQLGALARAAGESGRWVVRLQPRGRSALARLASLTALVDMISVYSAIALDRDPTPIDGIDRIKAEMGP